MKQKVYNKAGLLALLLVVVVGLASCSHEAIQDVETDNGQSLLFNINVGDYHAFSSTETRAIGTPDPGKNSWEAGDKVFVKITLRKYNFGYSDILHIEYLTYKYDGSSWNCIFGNEKIPMVKDNLGTIVPFRYTRFQSYYNPAYDWVFNSESNSYELENSGSYTEAVNEAFVSSAEDNVNDRESIDFTIDFQGQMANRLYSRVRVVAAPNVEVSLSGEGLKSSWIVALNKNQTLDNSHKARTVTDSSGNAFFYISWQKPTPLTIETYNLATKALIKQKAFTPLMNSIAGKSYEIDMR